MLLPQKVLVHWCPANRKHYESLGYIYTGMRAPLEIEAKDLSKKSSVRVQVECDYCHRIYETPFKVYWASIQNGQCCCSKCHLEKAKKTNIIKYGVDNPFKSKEVQEEIKTIIQEKYGVDNVGQSEAIKEKIAKTNLQRYGVICPLTSEIVKQKAVNSIQNKYAVDNPFKSKQIQQRIKEYWQQNYGVDNPSQIQSIINKKKQTSLLKRGVECPFQDPEVIAKIRKSLGEQNKVPSSKAEHEMCLLLKDIFGEENCIPSFALDQLNFDCLVKYKGINIDVEYDGWYWHKDKIEKDKRRNYFVTNKGYKVIRFISKKELPTKDLLEKEIKSLAVSNESIKIIKLDI